MLHRRLRGCDKVSGLEQDGSLWYLKISENHYTQSPLANYPFSCDNWPIFYAIFPILPRGGMIQAALHIIAGQLNEAWVEPMGSHLEVSMGVPWGTPSSSKLADGLISWLISWKIPSFEMDDDLGGSPISGHLNPIPSASKASTASDCPNVWWSGSPCFQRPWGATGAASVSEAHEHHESHHEPSSDGISWYIMV